MTKRLLKKRILFTAPALEAVMFLIWLMSNETALLFTVYVCPTEVKKKKKQITWEILNAQDIASWNSVSETDLLGQTLAQIILSMPNAHLAFYFQRTN